MEIFGGNFYPQLSLWVLDGTAERVTRRRRRGTAADLEHALRVALQRTGRPVMLTETSVSAPVWERRQWLDDSVIVVDRIRAEGPPDASHPR